MFDIFAFARDTQVINIHKSLKHRLPRSSLAKLPFWKEERNSLFLRVNEFFSVFFPKKILTTLIGGNIPVGFHILFGLASLMVLSGVGPFDLAIAETDLLKGYVPPFEAPSGLYELTTTSVILYSMYFCLSPDALQS